MRTRLLALMVGVMIVFTCMLPAWADQWVQIQVENDQVENDGASVPSAMPAPTLFNLGSDQVFKPSFTDRILGGWEALVGSLTGRLKPQMAPLNPAFEDYLRNPTKPYVDSGGHVVGGHIPSPLRMPPATVGVQLGIPLEEQLKGKQPVKPNNGQPYIPGELIVPFKAGDDSLTLQMLSRILPGGSVKKNLGSAFLVSLPADTSVDDALSRLNRYGLNAQPNITYSISPVTRVTNGIKKVVR